MQSTVIGDVDRTAPLPLPSWIEEQPFPSILARPPQEYNLAEVEQWLHEEQKDGGTVAGPELFGYLLRNNMFGSCLSAWDLEAIRERGVDVFRRFFTGKTLLGWGSIAFDVRSRVVVARLRECNGVLEFDWLPVDSPNVRLGAEYPVLRFLPMLG